MSNGRIIRKNDLEALRSVDEAREQLTQDRSAQEQELEAQRQEILREAQMRALRDSMQTANRLIMEAEVTAEKQLKSLEADVVALVSATVAEIIGDMDQEEAVQRATARALVRLRDHRRARITAAPDVFPAVRSAVSEVGSGGAEVVDVVSDPRLEAGRTILSSDQGHVEIGLADQIAAVTEAWSFDEVSAGGGVKGADNALVRDEVRETPSAAGDVPSGNEPGAEETAPEGAAVEGDRPSSEEKAAVSGDEGAARQTADPAASERPG